MPTEYGGDETTKNSVQGLGPDGARKLKTHEKSRLYYLTGQTEDPAAPKKSDFFYGVDPDEPEFDWDPEFAPKAGQ